MYFFGGAGGVLGVFLHFSGSEKKKTHPRGGEGGVGGGLLHTFFPNTRFSPANDYWRSVTVQKTSRKKRLSDCLKECVALAVD